MLLLRFSSKLSKTETEQRCGCKAAPATVISHIKGKKETSTEISTRRPAPRSPPPPPPRIKIPKRTLLLHNTTWHHQNIMTKTSSKGQIFNVRGGVFWLKIPEKPNIIDSCERTQVPAVGRWGGGDTGGHPAVYVTTCGRRRAPLLWSLPSSHSSASARCLLGFRDLPGSPLAAQCHQRAAGGGGGIPVHPEHRARPRFGPMCTAQIARHSPPGLGKEGSCGERSPRPAQGHLFHHVGEERSIRHATAEFQVSVY